MASSSRQSDKATRQWHVAQALIANEAMKAALDLFSDMTPASLLSEPAVWLRRFTEIVTTFREQSRRLSIGYYRLIRAIETDRSVNLPGEDDAATSLGQLWNEFDAATNRAQSGGHRDQTIGLDDSPWRDEPGDHADRATASSFYVNGPRRLERFAKKNAHRLDTPEFAADLDELMASIGNQLAAEAGRLAEDGGREAVHEAVDNDPRAVGYYRQPQPGACAFCLMLASRGAVYKTRKAAGRVVGRNGHARGNAPLGAPYHRNCHCQPRPIFSRAYRLPAISERARADWKTAADANGGALDYNAWRRWLAKHRP